MDKNNSEMQTIILTMHLPLWQQMVKGIKKMDIRSTRPKENGPYRVLVYVTGGVGVVGEFKCKRMNELKTMTDYINAEKKSLVAMNYIFDYARKGKRKVYGWDVSDVRTYEKSLPVSDFGLKRAPMSWQYIKEAV